MTGDQGYLLDTNAISEIRKPRPNADVIAFLHSIGSESSYLSVLTLGELRRGAVVKRQRHPQMTERFSLWVDSLEVEYTDRLFKVDKAIATLWGELTADRTHAAVDTLLAATAIVHSLTLVTRNTKDLAGLPVKIMNPWQA